MRLALLGLAASLSSLPLLAQDDLRVSRSSVTIAATFSRPDTVGEPVDRPNDDDVNVTTKLDSYRYGNSEILDALVEADTITAKKGYSIVAVWADWPDTGNSYKFFLRKKGEDPVAIDPATLGFELTDPFVGKTVRLSEGVVVSGSDSYKSLATFTLGALTDADEIKRPTAAGSASGVLFGTGNYVRPSGATVAIYRPRSLVFVGYGEADNTDGADDVLQVKLKIGASSAVAAELFEPTPVNPSVGADGTPVPTLSSTDSGILTLGGVSGSGSDTTVNPGATLSEGDSQPGSTVLGSAL